MKKFSRTITSGNRYSRYGDRPSRSSRSQGSKRTDDQQSDGATTATGDPKPSPTGEGNDPTGDYQPPKEAGGGSKKRGGSKNQEFTDHDLPVHMHMKPTISSRQSKSNKIDVTTTKNIQDDVEQLQKECEGHKQAYNQLYVSYQKLARDYRLKEEENDKLNSQVSRLQDELSRIKEESDVAGLKEFVQQQHEKLVLAERERDTAIAKLDQKGSEQKQIELNSIIVQTRNNHALIIKSKDDEITNLKADIEGLVQAMDSKDQEIAELKADKKDLEEKLAQTQARITAATQYVGDDDGKELGSCTPLSAPDSQKNSALITVLSPVSKENEQTTAIVNSAAEKLSKHLIKTSGDSTGVGAPCIDPTHSEVVGGSRDEGNDGADAINSEMRLLQAELLESQSKVDELTNELAVEKSATENAKSEMDKLMNQLQQLQHDKRALQQQMNGTGDSFDYGHCDTDDSIIPDMNKLTVEFKQATETALMVYCNKLTEGIKNQEKKATKAFQNQLSELQYEKDTLKKELAVQRQAEENAKNRVDELTKELAIASENAKIDTDKLMNQLQQLQNDKRILEQQMNDGYKEREDRIAELEEFVNDQLAELDRMEEAMKQTFTNKQILQKDYQKVNEQYSLAKIEMNNMKDQLKQLETERKAQEQQLKQLETERKALEQQMNDGYKEREDRIAELEEFVNDQVAELDKMEGTMKQTIANKKILEEDYQALQAQLKKALDPLENIEELKELVDLDEEIGRGAWGLVKKVSLHGTICAAKDIHAILINYASSIELERIKKSFLEECIKCSKLFHPNLVQFLGIHYPSKQVKLPWLVMELLDCSLTGFLKKHAKENVSLFVKASIFCDISLGLQFLHGRDIIHRDLSSNNILLTRYLTAKITDLGVAKLVNPDGSKSHTVVPGTQHFLPPEVFSEAAKSHYGKSIDVFSLGCIMIHVTAHEWPEPLPLIYYDPKLKKRVALSEVERRAAYMSKIQGLPELKVLIENCLHDDSEMRPNATTMVDELGRLKLSYQKNSNFAGEEMNAVEYEKNLKLLEKRLSEQVLEREKLNKTIQEAHKILQDHLICHKCNRQFKDSQLQEYRHHVDKCCQ